MYYDKKNVSAVLISILLTTTAYAGCPAPDAIHPQKIINKHGDDESIEGARLIAEDSGGSGSQWISSNYQTFNQTLALHSVEIASLEPSKHGLTCIYSVGEDDPLYRIKMYEPIFYEINYSKIKLANEKEWSPLFDDKYGYVCIVSATAQCEWSYDY